MNGNNSKVMVERINTHGLKFILTEDTPKTTTVALGDKVITMNISLTALIAGWYKWQIKDYLIQNAFPTLNPDEREFLITGTTTTEWDDLFGDE